MNMRRGLVMMGALALALACASVKPGGMNGISRVMRPDELSYAATDPPPSLERAFYEYKDPGIVVVALGSEGVTDDDDDDESESKPALAPGAATDDAIEVQMQIVAKAAEYGPVVILVPDSQSQTHLESHCDRFSGLCEAFAQNRVRFVVVNHEGTWIRDFGPMIAWDIHGRAIVLDSRYFDIRHNQSVVQQRHQINQQRLSVLQLQEAIRSRGDKGDDGGDDSLFSSRIKLASLYDYLTKMNDVLKDAGDFARDLDDLAPYPIAEALFTPESFSLYRPPLFLDGGNLVQLEGGKCLTTTDLISANGGRDDLVRDALSKYFGCRQIVVLEALPGPVIKHVDMFLMPVSGDHVLLASFRPEDYDPADENDRNAYFESVQAAGEDLIIKAAIAMRDNERKLTEAGIKVTRVPGLLPRVSDGDIYYPTNLNGLVHVSPDGRRQVFVPTYAGYAAHQQDQALKIIKQSFGSGTEIVTIEATAAAKLQGAVHCLTMLVPAGLTYILDPRHEALRKSIADNLGHQQEKMTENQELELRGTWLVKKARDLPVGLAFQFRESDLSIVGGDKQVLAHYLFDGLRVRQRTWTMNMRQPDVDKPPETVSIEWVSPRNVRFVYGKNKETIELQRQGK
jgi:agmatine/peptidylarginine deiminase